MLSFAEMILKKLDVIDPPKPKRTFKVIRRDGTSFEREIKPLTQAEWRELERQNLERTCEG